MTSYQGWFVGSILQFNPSIRGQYDAPKGALARIIGLNFFYVNVIWIDRHKFNNHTQMDGNYYPKEFTLSKAPKRESGFGKFVKEKEL